jgi:hypothetical protein
MVRVPNPSEEFIMATKGAALTDEEKHATDSSDTAEKLDHVLDRWRARIDELKVQVDLANLDVREDLAKRLEVTENVYLAVKSRLIDASHDTGKNAANLRHSIDGLLVDLRRAYDDAEAVVKRSHQA